MEPHKKFHWLDYLVFAGIIITSAGIGIFHGCYGRKDKSTTDYLLGSRQLKWLPVGLSILVTFQSAVLYLGVPAEVYTRGTSYLLFHIGMAASVIICATLFVPLLFPLKLTSTYEYLERRFQSKTARVIGSVLGIMNMSLYVGVVIFAPASAMEAASGFPMWASILLISSVATFYTMLGGLRAVIWTDVFQFLIMCSGLLAMLIQGCKMQGGINRVLEMSQEGGRIDFSSFDMDPRTRHTVWGLVIGSTLTWLSNIGVNQANVQRFSAVPSLSAAKWAVLLSMPGFVVFGVLASLLGLVVYAYFVEQGCDPLKAKYISNPNQLVPLFVQELFDFLPGFTGLFIASLFCASLSTVSSSINSLAAMAWEDIIKPRVRQISDRSATLIIKALVVVFGVVAMGVAFISMQLGGPATQIALSFFGASGGPLLGMYLLGCFFPWANWIGVSSGALVAVSLCMWIAVGSFTIPPIPGLPPAPTTGCHLSSNGHYTNGNGSHYVLIADNFTRQLEANLIAANSPEPYHNPLEPLYRISYLWYSSIGLTTVILVGLLVSFITGPSKPEDLDPSLMVPFFDKFCCCLPASLKARLRCGVLYPTASNRRHSESSHTQSQDPEAQRINTSPAIANSSPTKHNGVICEQATVFPTSTLSSQDESAL